MPSFSSVLSALLVAISVWTTCVRGASTDFPQDRLRPCPDDWSPADWNRYQDSMINTFKGCMPRCCGNKNCWTNPAGLKECQDHCIQMGSNNYNARNPKTGKMAPPPALIRRGMYDFPPNLLGPCPVAPADCQRYEDTVKAGYKKCMPYCCGFSSCHIYPPAIKKCQDNCLDMGKRAWATGNL
ncbi:hypothetical protein BZA05DRAFT_394637 [Tricharina praecox]|uniref:uncharacterized protein n=1 Tax=Tricharina praecox TaxID=43433 RepID=UPI00221ECDEF|nr:uncharacterized protein BZA05DRAFT_394637 [Tricharina praecox]KAI5853768.1 hypothetical protein BZA05DRAFT_394637 [Tricharina praecox]